MNIFNPSSVLELYCSDLEIGEAKVCEVSNSSEFNKLVGASSVLSKYRGVHIDLELDDTTNNVLLKRVPEPIKNKTIDIEEDCLKKAIEKYSDQCTFSGCLDVTHLGHLSSDMLNMPNTKKLRTYLEKMGYAFVKRARTPVSGKNKHNLYK
ncbi:MAG: hypothetical protein Tp185DCM00d2C31949991_5 [Prokaryotic dsDNA virus sp.]|nr:MAG: hypothetical protein Tp162SUR1511541_51 [Prokaryotic dsDNA virus sp.]QDP56717.1 MAG: hypothetical protein Tp185DCM00d2C31949991_5 [Prokaryotic dsDNA virus sp.]QDP63765.1 MAG: hypothetical protein Unbinned2480contig1002_19 [Prokaryotic dsDNA virus sp.]QDP63821.1 MAG: hypothetical protein GOVbin2429_5 [Prokaryotic dsDNA virus sp.]|tara:strand:+ start:33420 stop:33872 length:453 start_codon:yes stop_codon:yes gene_type:complete